MKLHILIQQVSMQEIRVIGVIAGSLGISEKDIQSIAINVL